MSVNFKNNKSILIGLISFAYIGLFFPLNISNITLIALLVYCVIKTKPKEYIHTFFANPFSKIIVSSYLLLVIGLTYTSDMASGFFVLEKKITFLLIPVLVMPILQKENLATTTTFKLLGGITIASSVILLVIACIKTFILKESDAFFFENFTSIHYVYYSLYFACGSLILIDSLFDESIGKPTGILLLIVLFGYSLAILILVASKTGILIFVFTSAIFFLRKIKSKKTVVILTTSLVLLSLSLLYFNDTSRRRFEGLSEHLAILQDDDIAGKETTITDLNMRLLFWKISVINERSVGSLLLGLGTGDVQAYLDDLYNQYKLYGYLGYDSHNEWVFTWLQLGVPGLLVLGWLFLKYFTISFYKKDLKMMLFLFVTFGFTQSESILESNKGIVFFALFFTLLASAYPSVIPNAGSDAKEEQISQ